MIKKILFLGVATLGLMSCKSDNNDNNSNSSIVGKWQPVSTIAYSGKTGVALPKYNDIFDDCAKKGSLQFGSDGKFNSVSYDNYNGACQIDDQTNGTYTFDAKTKILTTTWGGSSFTGKVRSVSKTDLALEGDAYEDLDGDGVNDIFVNNYIRQ